MRTGFLNGTTSTTTSEVYVLKGNNLAGHIGERSHPSTADTADRDVIVEFCNGEKRKLRHNQFCNISAPAVGQRVLSKCVSMNEADLTQLLSNWSPTPAQTDDVVSAAELQPVQAPRPALLPELIDHILSFLAVPRVNMLHVKAESCSSVDEGQPSRCSLDKALDPSPDTWWISGPGKFDCGVGAEWVSFRLGDPGVAYRLERVTLVIPPLPHGPLSVRDFHLEAANTPEGPWESSHSFNTLDTGAAQPFYIAPPIEAAYVRIVCTRNAARAAADKTRATMVRRGVVDPSLESEEDRLHALRQLPSSVGFFTIAFA